MNLYILSILIGGGCLIIDNHCAPNEISDQRQPRPNKKKGFFMIKGNPSLMKNMINDSHNPKRTDQNLWKEANIA